MGDLAGWGDVTLIVHTDDGIMEFTGAIPQGQVGRGYFNLMGSKGFHQDVPVDDVIIEKAVVVE